MQTACLLLAPLATRPVATRPANPATDRIGCCGLRVDGTGYPKFGGSYGPPSKRHLGAPVPSTLTETTGDLPSHGCSKAPRRQSATRRQSEGVVLFSSERSGSTEPEEEGLPIGIHRALVTGPYSL